MHPLMQGIHMAVEVLIGGWIIILASHIGVTGKELLQLGIFLWGGLGEIGRQANISFYFSQSLHLFFPKE